MQLWYIVWASKLDLSLWEPTPSSERRTFTVMVLTTLKAAKASVPSSASLMTSSGGELARSRKEPRLPRVPLPTASVQVNNRQRRHGRDRTPAERSSNGLPQHK